MPMQDHKPLEFSQLRKSELKSELIGSHYVFTFINKSLNSLWRITLKIAIVHYTSYPPMLVRVYRISKNSQQSVNEQEEEEAKTEKQIKIMKSNVYLANKSVHKDR